MDPTEGPDQLTPRPLGQPGNGRPVRKDEIELDGVYIESWYPERRSRRKPLLFVHGELTGSWLWERWLGYFARRGWEGHALNLRNHFWSQTTDPTTLTFDSYVDDVTAAVTRLGPSVVVIGHGMGALLSLAAVCRQPASALVLLAPEPPAGIRPPAQPHQLRETPDVYGREVIGWSTLPERLARDQPDLSFDDVLRVQHLLGQKPHESGAARRTMIAGVVIDRDRLPGGPRLVIGAGLDRQVPEPLAERTALWLDAEYEPFGAHSHYGLIIGEESHLQVADRVKSFLEGHRL
jgi:pimeloyl-ACP methyl ester carboxylesterase